MMVRGRVVQNVQNVRGSDTTNICRNSTACNVRYCRRVMVAHGPNEADHSKKRKRVRKMLCQNCGHKETRHFVIFDDDGELTGCGECYQALGMIDAFYCEGFVAETE